MSGRRRDGLFCLLLTAYYNYTPEEKLNSVQESIVSANSIEDPKLRRNSLLSIARGLLEETDLQPLYVQAMTCAIRAADEISGAQYRIHALLTIFREIPAMPEFDTLRLRALRSALNLATTVSQPHYERRILDHVAKTLPKSCDVSFYRQYTLLGIAKEIPRTGEFLNLYREAMGLAISAATTIGEPFYRKYALCYIAEELSKAPELFPLYKQTIVEAFKAASSIADPLVRINALIDILRIFPKTSDFFPLLEQTLKNILDFYSVKKRIREFTPMEVIDFILAAEEKGIREPKKRRYTKTKYAHMLTKELEQFGLLLNDIRFIEILKPYTHVWIRPRELRMAVVRVVDHLEGLKKKFHGREIERPALIRESFQVHEGQDITDIGMQTDVKECISIDLGTTNTVIMRNRHGSQPEFITLKEISSQYSEAPIVPTVLGLESDSIGTAAGDSGAVANFKKMLLEGNQNAGIFMERFFALLYRHLKKEFQAQRWFSLFSNSLADKLYITVPVGFPSYEKAIKEIAEKTIKNTDIELLEEPLAAAIGYQIADLRDKVVMIIDFGGSTLDIMIVRLNINEVHVIAKPDRSKMLGGHDIDVWLAGYLSEKAGLEGKSPPAELVRIAEDIKIGLSGSKEVSFRWEGYEVCRINRRDLEEVLDRHDFYKTVDRSISYVLWRAEKVGIKKDKIEAILLTGGSSQIPSFKEKIASLFPYLCEQNSIYNHSPFSAVATGAALYASRNITDKHLGLAYALRYHTGDKEAPFAYEIILEKGEPFPLEKTFRVTPARTLGEQRELYLELFEIPERFIVRRWEKESGMEFIKQVVKPAEDILLKDLKIITLPFDKPIEEEVCITFYVNDSGQMKIRYGRYDTEMDPGIRLQ